MSELDFGYRLNKQAEEFFLYEYFGIVAKNYNEEIKEDTREVKISKCVRRAYLDMNRTLVLDKGGEPFYDTVGKKLAKKLAEIKSAAELCKDAYSVFFDCEGNVNESISKLLKSKTLKDQKKRQGEPFYYGQAQKWINMSLKYMWLIGLINEQADLVPPIDKYIMQGAPDSVTFPKDDGSSAWSEYNEDKSMPWSKLSKNETNTIQTRIKESIDITRYPAPILWECDTWIIQSETEKRKHRD